MVENRDLASLAYVKRAGVEAQNCWQSTPRATTPIWQLELRITFRVEPAPVRWLLRLYGAQTDKETGIQKLQLTAAKGHYLLPFARLLLAVAALRDHNHQEARELLQNLAEAFPNNRLYSMELARLH